MNVFCYHICYIMGKVLDSSPNIFVEIRQAETCTVKFSFCLNGRI